MTLSVLMLSRGDKIMKPCLFIRLCVYRENIICGFRSISVYCFSITNGLKICHTGIILCMHPANEWWYYNITSSLSGWAHAQNDSWTYCNPWILFLRCQLNHCYKKICEAWHPSRSQSWCSLFPLANLPRHWIMANIKSFWTCELLPVISVSFLQISSIIRDNLLLIQG